MEILKLGQKFPLDDLMFILTYFTKNALNKEDLPTILPGHLWSFQLCLANKLGCTQTTEYRNKTQKHGMLLSGYIQQHNQAAPLSCIQLHIKNFSSKLTKRQEILLASYCYLNWLKSGSSTISSKRSIKAFNFVDPNPRSSSIWK